MWWDVGAPCCIWQKLSRDGVELLGCQILLPGCQLCLGAKLVIKGHLVHVPTTLLHLLRSLAGNGKVDVRIERRMRNGGREQRNIDLASLDVNPLEKRGIHPNVPTTCKSAPSFLMHVTPCVESKHLGRAVRLKCVRERAAVELYRSVLRLAQSSRLCKGILLTL